jgi:large subunit ribosomal protein L25
MSKYSLKSQPRKVSGRAVKSIRSLGLIPAHVYGQNLPSQNLEVNLKEFQQIYKQVGESSLLYLDIHGQEPKPVFITDVTRHPLTNLPLHISFHQVNLKTKVTAAVKLNLIGESLAVKDGLGVLVQQADQVEIEALPSDMPEHLDIDISTLVQVGDTITLNDLKLSTSLEPKSDLSTILVKIEPLAKAEEPTPTETAPTPEGDSAQSVPETQPATE